MTMVLDCTRQFYCTSVVHEANVTCIVRKGSELDKPTMGRNTIGSMKSNFKIKVGIH